MKTKLTLIILTFAFWLKISFGQPCVGTDLSGTTSISTNTTWSSNSFTNADITVQTGVELTITSSTILFDDAKLILEQGARLTITNSTLKPCGTNKLWPGIVATGNNAITQVSGSSFNTNQTIVFVDNSAIEYAKHGIWAGYDVCSGGSSYADIAPFECGGGAVIRCRNTSFTNCKRAVIFNSYSHDNYSYFVDCNFEWNDPEPWYSEYNTFGDPENNFWGGFEMVHLNEVKGISFLGGNDFINSVEFDDWDGEQVDKDGDGNPDTDGSGNPIDVHYLDGGISNENRGRGIFSRQSSFMLRRGGGCHEQPDDVMGTGGYECVGDVNTFEGFYATISISEKQDLQTLDPISDNSVAITGTRFWSNSVAVFCYEKLQNLFINRCKIANYTEYSYLQNYFLGFYKYFGKFKPQGILILSEIRMKFEISDNKVYFLEQDATKSWNRLELPICDMEDWKVNINDDPDRISCIAVRNMRNNHPISARIYRNYVGMRNEDLSCQVTYSAIDLQANFATLNLECNHFFVDFDRSTTLFPRHDLLLYHGDDTKSGYLYNIPDIGSMNHNSGNDFHRDHTVAPDCIFWNNPPYNFYGNSRKFVYFPDGNQFNGSSFINAGTPIDVNYYRLVANDITDPYCFTNPPSGSLNIYDAPDNPCSRSNPSNFHGESTPVPGMGIYLVTDISTAGIEEINPTSVLDDYPYEDGFVTTYENENIEAFVVYNWNSVDETDANNISLSTNLINTNKINEIVIKGLDTEKEYQTVLFNVKGQVFHQGEYRPGSAVFGTAHSQITSGMYYLHLTDTKGAVKSFKILVIE